MPIYKPAHEQIIEAVNKQNSIGVTLDAISFSLPKDISSTPSGAQLGLNTSIKITAVEGKSWAGSRVVQYERYDLADLHVLIGDTLALHQIDTVAKLIGYMNQRYGMVLTEEDLQPGSITVGADGTGTVKLTANPISPAWIGTVTFKIVKGDAPLDQLLTNRVLDGLKYPNGELGHVPQTKRFAQIYTYPMDFSKNTTELKAIGTGPLSVENMALIGRLLNLQHGTSDSSPWNSSNDATWGLAGATVVLSGMNNSHLPTNQKQQYVLQVRLGESNTGWVDDLYLAYSDPENAGIV